MSISPNDTLPNGTKVRVGNKRGVVIACETVRAVPSGMISVHTINFTSKITGATNRKIAVPIDETKQVGYAFIETI